MVVFSAQRGTQQDKLGYEILCVWGRAGGIYPSDEMYLQESLTKCFYHAIFYTCVYAFLAFLPACRLCRVSPPAWLLLICTLHEFFFLLLFKFSGGDGYL